MKTTHFRNRHAESRQGFTLIELLIVITIIALLAALTIGAFSNAQTTAGRNRTLAYMTAIKSGLEQYKEKWGEYPDISATAAGKMDPNTTKLSDGGAIMLYQALTGDGNDAINQTATASASSTGFTTDDVATAAAKVANGVTSNLPKAMIYQNTHGYMLMDGFAHPFQYQKTIVGVAAAGGAAAPPTINPTYDLWSYGNSTTNAQMDNSLKGAPASGGTGGEPTTWIKNW
jgi:prepilin-type N-terminal cleavage/methylation domain-containing protein